MVVLFILVGVLIGLLLKPKAKDQVMKIIERDKRFIDFNITQENAFSLECERKKGFPPQRFLKVSPGFTGQVGRFLKRGVTRFIGKEGTAYTWKTQSSKVKIGSLAKALRGLWGKKFYDQVPEVKRKQLEESKISVTVDIDPGLTPKGYKPASEEDIKQEQDRLAAETWWEGKKQADKGTWLQYLFIAGFGFGVALALQILGVLRI